MVLIAESEVQLQTIINYAELWCNMWRLCEIKDKTKVMHFWDKRKQICNTNLVFNGSELEIIKQYKYVGVFLDGYLDFNVTVNVLAFGAGRAFGAVLTNIGFKSFTNNL